LSTVVHTYNLSVVSQDIGIAVKFTGAGAATVGVAASGSGIRTVIGSLVTSCTRNLSLKQQLLSAILGFVIYLS
ncbi:ATP synthase F(0) complex subunit C1, mitochondrial, partial [Lemmus lemmus]